MLSGDNPVADMSAKAPMANASNYPVGQSHHLADPSGLLERAATSQAEAHDIRSRCVETRILAEHTRAEVRAAIEKARAFQGAVCRKRGA
jgi:hypothetical protein